MQQHLEAGLKSSSAMGSTPEGEHETYALMVDAAVEQRDQDALREYTPLAEQTAAAVDHKLNIGIAHRAWGVAHTLAGEFPQADARFRQALELFAAYPAPWQIARTLFEMGELAGAQLHIESARDLFSQALEAFEKLHAEPYAARTRAALERLPGA